MNKFAIIIILFVLATAAFLSLSGLKLPSLENGPTPSPTPSVSSDLDNLIRLASPTPNQSVKSPLSVSGEARGYWFFEASFPVRIFDGNGTELGVIPAQA